MGWVIFLSRLRLGVNVERGDDFKAFLFKTAIGEQREAEIADADEHDRLQAFGAELVGDHLRQLLDIVAEAARAELAEIGEVLAKLGGLDARDLGQRLAGDGADGVVLQPRQAAQINGQTIDRFARNFRAVGFFQAAKGNSNPDGHASPRGNAGGRKLYRTIFKMASAARRLAPGPPREAMTSASFAWTFSRRAE